MEILDERDSLQRVGLDDDSRAYCLTELIGTVAVGDHVVINSTAVELGLGTGGWHVIHWNLAHDEFHRHGPGHIMKLRYTSLQVDCGSFEEHIVDPPLNLPDLGGVPILIGSLHSQVGVAAAVLKDHNPSLRVSYVMTDGAALPLALSDLVAALRSRGLLDGTITAGHAFGGDVEAVSVPSALQIAVEYQRADVVICAMGPGVVGTGGPLGTTAVEVASIITATAQLGGRPVVMARASDADGRDRHRGISHHTRTALALTPVRADLPVPGRLADEAARLSPHRVVVIEAPHVGDLLERSGLRVTTMGRTPLEDPLAFEVTAAAALHAARLADSPDTVRPR